MKKRLLLFAAVLTASANLMFAAVDDKTVQDSNGNSFVYNPQTDLDPNSFQGQTTAPNTASISPNGEYYMLTINSDLTTTISDCNLIYNVKLINISENPGTIGSFSERLLSSTTEYDVVVSENQIVTYVYEGEGEEREIVGYSVKENSDAYKKRYLKACERAVAINNQIVTPGSSIKAQYDFEGMEINAKLYYLVSGKKVKTYKPILNVNGVYRDGVIYNNSFVTYNPVGIADEYNSYEVDGTGKVGYVHGAVDDSKVEEILNNPAYSYLNYDFSDATVLGSVSTDINDNRIAYFTTGTNASGKNIVVGQNSESYEISDNGQEIYVYKNFVANETKYYRNFKADTYGTIVVPFNISSASDVFTRMGRLTGYDEDKNEISTTMAELIVANTPYLLEISSNASELTGDMGTTVWATKVVKSGNYNGAQFFGTFEPIKGSDAILADHGYVVGENGHFGKLNQNSTMKPGRCYFEYVPTAGGNAKLDNATVLFIDEETGTVETMKANFDQETTAIDGVVNSSDVVLVQYISANGQISNEPVNGLNIVKKTYSDGSVEISKVIF